MEVYCKRVMKQEDIDRLKEISNQDVRKLIDKRFLKCSNIHEAFAELIDIVVGQSKQLSEITRIILENESKD